MNQTGIQCLNSSGVMNGRTLTGTTNQFTVTNGDGISGNPTIAWANPAVMPGIFASLSGSTGSIANAGTFTIFDLTTLANTGVIQVCAYATGTATAVRAYAYVGKSLSTAGTSNQYATSGCTITISGTNVILTNTSGGSLSFNYAYILYQK